MSYWHKEHAQRLWIELVFSAYGAMCSSLLLVFKIKDCVLARVDSLLEDVSDEARWEWRQPRMRKRLRVKLGRGEVAKTTRA